MTQVLAGVVALVVTTINDAGTIDLIVPDNYGGQRAPDLAHMERQFEAIARERWGWEERPPPTVVAASAGVTRPIVVLPSEGIRALYAAYDWGTVSLDTALAIGWCESKYNANAISDTGDWGLMQINRRAHESRVIAWYGSMEAMLNPALNLDYASFLARDQGTAPWANSRHCWQR